MKLLLAPAALLLAACQVFATPPESLSVGEGFTNPIGYHDATPAFSWKLPAGVESQSAYRIEATSGESRWDSGWVESAQSTFVPYGGEPLESRQRVEWRVRVRDQDGADSGWSEPANFELGLLTAADWQAQWIRPTTEEEHNAGDYELVRAVYRSVANPDKNIDVTAIVREQPDGFSVTNDAMGSDPARLEPKELLIEYKHAGVAKTVTYPENRPASFPPSRLLGEPVGVLRREFSVAKSVDRARLYVTARGLFEVSLNGQRVGNDHFANGWTPYHNRIDTVTYDVTDHLRKGENSLESLLGYGWYAGRLTWTAGKQGFYGKHPELLLQLEVTYDDGSTESVVSDGGWEGAFGGPVQTSSIYDGEEYDARDTKISWAPVVANADLGEQQLIPKPFAPVRETRTLAAQQITEPEPGRFVFDLGQNMVGWARLQMPVEKDQQITIRFAEMLNDDGTLYTVNYRNAKSVDSYTAAESGVIDWQPRFTFHGFRYVELSGLPDGVAPRKDWVTGVVTHSDLKPIGEFKSSHAKLNQLQSNILWGWRGNSVDIPTDCPQRDERLGWTGDAQAFCPTAMLNYDCLAFWKSWLGSMRDDQFPDGRVPHVIPDVLRGGDSPGWQDAATMIPWEVYLRTGDKEVLSENYEMMEKFVGWYRQQSVDWLSPNIKGYGDWLQPYSDRTKGDTPHALLGAAFHAHSTEILANSARVLGREEDARRYADEAAKIKQAFAAYYLDSGGKLQNAPETQTAYVLTLAFELVPEESRAKVGKHLVRLIEEADGHLRTGFLGTPYLTKTLDDIGRPDLAYDLLFKETYPSWFYSINQGATTMWERWNSYTRDKGFGDPGMNSFNHYAYGAIGQWMYERVAGLAIDPAHPGYKHFFVRPLIGDQLDSAQAEIETPYGRAASAWEKQGDRVVMEIVVPPNTTATVEFPDGREPVTLAAGEHRFESRFPSHPVN
ncbi:Bacterial alpha-L-rhamnosidase [Posidoniimonas polymericola]|uniref:alpha-L-rhamnosidase n=1 Tax=Posidoniimonas polymericola TaxID=2528002 RepID=A0A5C5XWH2_9BACT|nr:family 78 glycoside hydrolase catalytic domain [Posidoniimonas polymericola]TWT66891.1 Bacterial alpha-L-rhamnosidase [Posidoniimonas polymericola]